MSFLNNIPDIHSIIVRILRILIIPFILTIVAAILISNKHPIFAKWLIRGARCIGRPIKSSIYVDGHLDKNITLYHVNKYFGVNENADYFIIIFPRLTEKIYYNIFFLDRMHNIAGIPVSTNRNDYDSISGFLFQSDVGAHYSLFTDDMKGFNFDPRLTFSENKILFNMPHRTGTYLGDSIRIQY